MSSTLSLAIEEFLSGQGPAEAVAAAGAATCRRQAARLVEASAVDDVVQESLVELLATVRRLRHPGAAEAWLALIVRKQAERHRRGLRLPIPLDLATEVPSPAEGPEALLLRAEQDASVRRALQAARDVDRRLLVLRYVGDWDDAELAALLGVTAGALRKRLHDARRRLRPHLEHLSPIPIREEPMTQPQPIPFGAVVAPSELADPPSPRPAPAGAELLPTGLRVIDAVVPIRRGGTVDFRGPVGSGHLVLISEVARNLATGAGGAVVAVATRAKDPDGSAARLPRMVEDPNGIPDLTVVIDASEDAARALEAAGGLAARLAAGGADVLLAVDRVTCGHLDLQSLAAHSGRVGPGSVTTIRVAPHARDASPAEAWPADTTLVLSLERMAAGIIPAVDVLASCSGLIDNHDLPEDAVAVANAVRRALAVAAALDGQLAQPMRVAEAYTGIPGVQVPPERARAELAAQL